VAAVKDKTLFMFGAVSVLIPSSVYLLPAAVSGLLSLRPANSALLGLSLYRSGKTTDCGPVESIRAINQRRAIDEGVQVMKLRYLRVRSEADMEEWDSSMGRFWVNRGASVAELYSAVAEQNEDIYGLSDLAPGSVVLACGAKYGVCVRKALKEGAAQVVAVEPDPVMVACLRRTFAPEIQAGRVIVYPKGVWDRDAVLALHRSKEEPRGLRSTGARNVKARFTTIDHLVSELRLSRVDFITLDIQGAEPRAVAGAYETIRQFHPSMSVRVYHDPGERAAVRKALSSDYLSESCSCAEQQGKIIRDVALLR
jgi:FkbM family methyltransferase